MTEQERKTASKQIFDRMCENYNCTDKKVSIFLPIERFSEIDTWLFLNELTATKFYLPVVKELGKLVHIEYEKPSQIEVSAWGIPEPVYGNEVDPSVFDYVLVPLLAINDNGYRVGYGKGFYDQFLSQCSPQCRFIGLSYFEPIDLISDLHEADIPLHACVTPNHFIKFNS